MENDEVIEIEETLENGEVIQEDLEGAAEPDGSASPDIIIDYGASPEEYYDVIYTAVNDALVAQTVTDGQSINSTALEYFRGVLLNQSPFTDYVVYVGESYTYWWNNYEHTGYEYVLAYGDLDLNGTTFEGCADIVTMRTSGDNLVSFMNDQYISVNAPLYYSRSNLGNYSGIIQKDYVGVSVLFGLALGGAVWLIKSFLSPKS